MTSACLAFSFGGFDTPTRPRVTRAPLAAYKTEYVQPDAWVGRASDRLSKLSRLEPGWDGYRAQPVTLENVAFAKSLLYSVMDDAQPSPDIVPGTRGDLQIEWHTSKGDLEVHVIRPNLVRAWVNFVDQDRELEVQISNDFRIVSDWLSQIKESEIATIRAAA